MADFSIQIRSIHSSLSEARKWAVSVRSCLSKIETWLSNPGSNMKKVSFNDVESLVRDDFTPCVEPGYPKLKVLVFDMFSMEFLN